MVGTVAKSAKRVASLSAAAAAAATAAAVARRASFGMARSALGLKAKAGAAAPASFVRSGKHGMAIRRVNSSDLAARRAAAAAAVPGTKKLRAPAATGAMIAAAISGKMEAGKLSPDPAARGKSAVALKEGASAGPSSAVAAAAASKGAASALLMVRKAALLSKARARSGASRKAAMVVAGARVKRARVLMRNLTLYRGKGGPGVVDGGGSGTGTGGQSIKQEEGANKSKKAKVKAEPCLFFCKFGKCSKSDEDCRFAHDKAKVAVCRAFLKGACEKKEKCLLTHAVQTEKMPVCIYFEKGLCFTPNCPYLHVKVSRNAAVCPKFLKVCVRVWFVFWGGLVVDSCPPPSLSSKTPRIALRLHYSPSDCSCGVCVTIVTRFPLAQTLMMIMYASWHHHIGDPGM